MALLAFKGTTRQLQELVSELSLQMSYEGIAEFKQGWGIAEQDCHYAEATIMVNEKYKELKRNKETITAP